MRESCLSDNGVYAYSERGNAINHMNLKDPKKHSTIDLDENDVPLVFIEKQENELLSVLRDGRVMLYDLKKGKSDFLAQVVAFNDNPSAIRTMKCDGNNLLLNDGKGRIIRLDTDTGTSEIIIDSIDSKVDVSTAEEYVVDYCKDYIVIDVKTYDLRHHYLFVYDYSGEKIRKVVL